MDGTKRGDSFDALGLEAPFAENFEAGRSQGVINAVRDFGEDVFTAEAFDAEPFVQREEPVSGDDPPGLERMLKLPGRFDDPKRDAAIEKDGTRFDRFLGGRNRRDFAASWLAQRPALAEAAREPMADLAAGDIAKAWFVIHDVGVKSSLGDRRFKAAAKATKKGSVHGFLNRAGYYAATHDFAKDRKGTVYEFLSRKGKKIAGGATINIETVPDIENGVADRADGSHGQPSKAELYASIGFRKAGGRKVNYYKWTKAAFDVLADLYILASARAGHLLTITAHKEIDRNLGRSVIWREYSAAEIRGAANKFLKKARDNPSDYHGDPYGFDVQALYDVITGKLNALGGAQMPAGARYGVHPLRLRTSEGADIGNGDGQLHEFPHQSDPKVKTDTGLKKSGWWKQGSKSEAEDFADETQWAGEDEEGEEGELEQEFEDSHDFEDEDSEAGLGGEATGLSEWPGREAASPWAEGTFGEESEEENLSWLDFEAAQLAEEDFALESLGSFEPEELAEALDPFGEVEADIEHCSEDEALGEDEEPRFEAEAWTDNAQQIDFRGRVLAAHVARTQKRKGKPLPDIQEGRLEAIPGTGIKTRPETAQAAGRLLAAARADLAKAQAAGDADAKRTTGLTVTSGYRGSDHQRRLWLGYFKGYYNKTQAAREALPGGPHGAAAVAYMLNPKGPTGFGIGGRIAAPGYSNHQNGIALDFFQNRQAGHGVRNSSDDAARRKWRASWFHKWLRQYAAGFGFKPLKSEEWHWEYQAGPGSKEAESDEAQYEEHAFEEDVAQSFEQEQGSAHSFKNCTTSQKTFLIAVAKRALRAVNHVRGFIGSAYGRPDKMSAATRALLMRHFHTTKHDHLRDIMVNLQRIAKAFEDGIKFQGETQCEGGPAGNVCGYAIATQWFGGFGTVHICFDPRPGHCNVPALPPGKQEAVVIHEVAHRYLGIDDKSYEWQAKYASLTPGQALDNADSYAYLSAEGFRKLIRPQPAPPPKSTPEAFDGGDESFDGFDESLDYLGFDEADNEDEAAAPARAFLGGSVFTYASRACGSRVSVFVPAAAQARSTADMMLFVHGLFGPCGGVPRGGQEGLVTAAPFALGKIVADCGRPLILVVPRFQSGDDRSWSAHRLDRPAAINALFAEVAAETGRRLNRAAPGIGQLIVAGHSRAFGVLYPLAKSHASPELGKGALARLSRVWALDATYGTPPLAAFESLAAAKQGLGIDIVYRAGSPTDKFKGASRAGAVALRPIARSISHCAVPAKLLPTLLSELPPPQPEGFDPSDEGEDLWGEAGVTETEWLNAEADALERGETWYESGAFGESEEESPDRFDAPGEGGDFEWEFGEAEAEAEAEAGEEEDEHLDAYEHEEQTSFAEDEGPVIDGEAPLWRLGKGFSRAPVAGGEVVGIVRDDGTALVAVDRSGKRPVALSAARAGMLEIGPGRPLFRCREINLAPPTGGATGELRGAPTGPVRFVLENGVEMLRVDGGTVVGAPASSLPPLLFALAGLTHGTRIAIDGLPHVVWMTFRLRDEAAERSRWVPAKATRKTIDDRHAAFDAAARRLSAGDRALVLPYLDLMAVVSVIEGGFGSRSGAGDTHASLGIFQWAMARNQSAETGSLGKFFATLKARAAGGDPLHVRAWGECVAKGLDIRDGDRVFTLGGAVATGAQVEVALAGAMAGEALSSYQLRAGVDWIEEFRSTPLTPGPLGKEFLGHGWRTAGAGKARLTAASGGVTRTLEVALPAAATIGQVFASQATLTSAVMLGVNRPAYVRLSLWRALAGSADPKTVVARLLGEIFAACAAAGQAPRPGKPFTEVQVNASGAAAQRAYRELQRYLASPATLPTGGEPALRAAFESKAMLLYKPSDARKYRREGRFATVRVRFP